MCMHFVTLKTYERFLWKTVNIYKYIYICICLSRFQKSKLLNSSWRTCYSCLDLHYLHCFYLAWNPRLANDSEIRSLETKPSVADYMFFFSLKKDTGTVLKFLLYNLGLFPLRILHNWEKKVSVLSCSASSVMDINIHKHCEATLIDS